MNGVVITCLLNAVPDPQRSRHIGAEVGLLNTLRTSVRRHGRHLVVLHDCLDEVSDEHTTFVRVEPGGNPYWHRWRCIDKFLKLPPWGFVWCVDGTDVEMLNDPFPHMEFGKIYVGGEEERLGIPYEGGTQRWLRGHCPSMVRWLAANDELGVLNVGTVGGDAASIGHLAHAITEMESIGDDYEMGAFNWLMRERWGDRVVTGHPVHSRFLEYETTSSAWWRHK